jgi:hypothetical protein
MSMRTRRWLAIAVCLAIPVSVVLLGWSSTGSPPDGIDPTYPPKCVAIQQQVEAGQPGDALTAARKLASDSGATREEQLCAQDSITKLDSPVRPALDLSVDPCALGKALAENHAVAAARAVYTLARLQARFATCATSSLSGLAAPFPAPQCAAIARQLATGPAQAAINAASTAVGSATTTEDDAVCVQHLVQTVASLTPPSPPTPRPT